MHQCVDVRVCDASLENSSGQLPFGLVVILVILAEGLAEWANRSVGGRAFVAVRMNPADAIRVE